MKISLSTRFKSIILFSSLFALTFVIHMRIDHSVDDLWYKNVQYTDNHCITIGRASFAVHPEYNIVIYF